MGLGQPVRDEGSGGRRADGLCPLPPAGRASLHDKASLRIEQVRSEDQGWYECKVLMLDQQYDTFHNGSWVHLTVNGESQTAARGGLRVRGQLYIQPVSAPVSLLRSGGGPWGGMRRGAVRSESAVVLGVVCG